MTDEWMTVTTNGSEQRILSLACPIVKEVIYLICWLVICLGCWLFCLLLLLSQHHHYNLSLVLNLIYGTNSPASQSSITAI